MHYKDKGISLPSISSWSNSADTRLQTAFRNRQSNLQVQGEEVVIKTLPDDLDSSRHLKFILKLSTDNTLLAHNIDLAPRISGLRAGDTVEFHGEYEWNPKGGGIHWKYHDPDNRCIGGWLMYRGRAYQ